MIFISKWLIILGITLVAGQTHEFKHKFNSNPIDLTEFYKMKKNKNTKHSRKLTGKDDQAVGIEIYFILTLLLLTMYFAVRPFQQMMKIRQHRIRARRLQPLTNVMTTKTDEQ